MAEFYSIGEEIEGGLYQAVSKMSGIKRAIKIVEKSTLENSNSIQNRVDLFKELDHPNICRLIEVIEDSNNFFLVMEFFSNLSLSSVIME